MAYQRKEIQPGPLLTVERARLRNAELRKELAFLTVENAKLEAQAETMRLKVTAARRNLTRKIRALDAARSQTEKIAKIKVQTSALPEPQYGGREGLQAAADEIEAYEAKGKLGTVTRQDPRHGSGRKYALGCQCDACLEWRQRRTEAQRATSNRRRELKAKAA